MPIFFINQGNMTNNNPAAITFGQHDGSASLNLTLEQACGKDC
jgi:hypothetical protein